MVISAKTTNIEVQSKLFLIGQNVFHTIVREHINVMFSLFIYNTNVHFKETLPVEARKLVAVSMLAPTVSGHEDS